jgi:hypothetical protein
MPEDWQYTYHRWKSRVDIMHAIVALDKNHPREFDKLMEMLCEYIINERPGK